MLLAKLVVVLMTCGFGAALEAVDDVGVVDQPIVVKVVQGEAGADGEVIVVSHGSVGDGEGEEEKVSVECIVLGAGADGGLVDLRMATSPGGFVWHSDGDADGKVLVRVLEAGDGDEDGPHALKRIVIKHKIGEGVEAGGPWLGIRFGPVPKPLAAHLGLDGGEGQMVLNVIDGSPADEAGLGQYDVILQIDGQAVSTDVASFLETVRGLEPGETYALSLIRAGEQMQVSLTVGTRPESAGHDFKFEDLEEIEELIHGQILRRGGMLEKDDEGNWAFKHLDLEGLPDVWKFFPEGEDLDLDFTFNLSGFPDMHAKAFVFEDGNAKTLRIEKDEDGEITVTRTQADEDGIETTTTKIYATEEELEQGDPDAHKMLGKGSGCHIGMFGGEHGKILSSLGEGHRIMKIGPGGMGFAFDIDLEEIHEGIKGAQKHSKEIREKLAEHFGSEGHKLDKNVFFFGKPRTSFEKGPNGEITVKRRLGDEELVETFSSVEALKAKRPELYEKFKRLQGDRGKKKSKH